MIATERRGGTRPRFASGAPQRSDPHFNLNLAAVDQAWADFSRSFGDALVCYAVKANPHRSILRRLGTLGSSFEAASLGEIEQLLALGIQPERVVFGTAVKARAQASAAMRLGIACFAADSAEELRMLATTAPGARVFVRVKGDDADSVFQMSPKFGVSQSDAAPLMLLARDLGLSPCGLSFNVGSQARRKSAWAVSLRRLAPVMAELSALGLRVDLVNLGGGFPAQYVGEPAPSLEEIGAAVAAEAASLPYPVRLMIEPGRRLVADAMTLVANVITRVERPEGPWLFLDCGVYNALFEALSCQGRTRYPVRALGQQSGATASFVLAGPTGDGLDIIARDVSLGFGVLQAAVYLLVYRGFGKGQLALLNPLFASFSGLTALLSVFLFGEFLGGRLALALAVTFAGVLLLNVDVGALRSARLRFLAVAGFPEVACATVLAAVWTILWDRFVHGRDWLTDTSLMYLFMTLALAAYVLVRRVQVSVPKRSNWAYLALIGVCEAVAYLSISWGYGATPHASVVALLSGAFSLPTVLLARVFLKERTTALQKYASLAIVAGIVLLNAG